MNISIYKTLLNDNGHSSLIKEKTVRYSKEKNLDTCEKIVNVMNDIFQVNLLDTEYIYMITLNSKLHPTAFFEISHGLVNKSLISAREILIKALLSNASGIIIIHNHPSGITTPSKFDLEVTQNLKKACNIIGVNLLDHIIIAGNSYLSFCKENLI